MDATPTWMAAAQAASAQLESSALGRHVLAAGSAERARALLGVRAAPDLPTDGTTDIGPLVQAAYDQGTEVLHLASGVTYLWSTPVFLDKDSILGGFVIEGNRARILLGTGLPTTNWVRDPTTRFAVFPNTKRSALAGGRVAVETAVRATGAQVGAVRPLTIRNVVLDGRNANVGFSYGNQCAVTFDQVVLWRARVGVTWIGYSDGNTFLNCYSRYGGAPRTQVMVEQTTPGDGLVILGGKADPPVTFARLKWCRGGVVQAMVTGRIELQDCSAIVVEGGHFEGQDGTTPMLVIRNSQVAFVGCVFYLTYDATVGSVAVDDSASTATVSDVAFTDCVVMQLVTADQRDVVHSPFVAVGMLRPGSRITARGLQSKVASSGAPGLWRDAPQPAVGATGAGGPLLDALMTPESRGVLASGDWLLRRASSTWEVLPAHGGPTVSRRQSSAPRIADPVADTGMPNGGMLAAGTTYSYVAAVQDALGGFTTLSSEVRATATGTRMLEVRIGIADAPGVLTLWRATAGSATAAPDRYVVLPVRGAVVHLYDTGSTVAGRPWTTTGVPRPRDVGSSNRTRDALILAGRQL